MRQALILGLALLMAVPGCSSEGDGAKEPSLGRLALQLAQSRLQRIRGVEQADEAIATAAPDPTRAQLQGLGKPVVMVAFNRFGTKFPALEFARNGSFDTYMSGDRSTVTLQDGIVVATRGQLRDLITQELSLSPVELLYQGGYPKLYKRSQRHLSGEGKLVTLEYDCAIAAAEKTSVIRILERDHRVLQLTELCRNDARAFQNTYWVDQAARKTWKSDQSVSVEMGHVSIERVIE